MSNLFTIAYWSTFWRGHAERILVATIKIAVIVTAYLILRFLIRRVIGGLLKSSLARLDGEMLHARRARLHALRSMIGSAIGFILGFLAAIMILQAAGINIVPLLTTASIAGLAIGFGAQKLVRDVISGFFILIEDQYGIGDYVTIGLVTGVVEDLQIRTTRIRDAVGKLYTLSNGDITQVCNQSRGDLLLSVDYAIAASADIDKARSVLMAVAKSVADEFPDDINEPMVCGGLVQISAASNVVRVTGTVSASAQEAIRFELNARAQVALSENDIAVV
ncbi:MAG: mechanosensitive ion channel [Armatimonadetes bacterium]|nr:mechanosensitive ion channel [Armatimonadota bacterium]